jgi:hypothetical protein
MLQTEVYPMIVIYDCKTFIGQDPTLEWSTQKVFHFSKLLPYPQTLYYSEAVFLIVCDPSMNELWET